MSVYNRCGVRDLSDIKSVRGRDTLVQPLRQGRVNDGDDDAVDSPFHRLITPPSRNSDSALVRMTASIAKFQFFLNSRLFFSMHRDGDKLYYVDARLSQGQDTVLGAWKERWKAFGRNGASFPGSIETQIDIQYIRCPVKHKCFAHLYTLVVFLNNVCGKSNQSEVNTVYWPCDASSFL